MSETEKQFQNELNALALKLDDEVEKERGMEIVTDNSNVIAELQRQNDELVSKLAKLERAEAHYWWKTGMANARRLIKAHKSTSNQALMANLFGMGFGSAGRRCRDIGLEPLSNKSSLNDMHPFDGEAPKQQSNGSNGE